MRAYHGKHQFEQIQVHPLIVFDVIRYHHPFDSYVILVCGSQTCQEPVTLMNYNVQYRATLFSFTERANIGQRLCDESLESGRNHLCLGFLAWSNQWDQWWGMHISKLKKIVTNRSHCEWWFRQGFQKIAPRPVNIL